MKKEIFMKALEKNRNVLVTLLVRRHGNVANANDEVHTTFLALLENKAYLRIKGNVVGGKVFSFLKSAVRKTTANIYKKQLSEEAVFQPLVEILDFDGSDTHLAKQTDYDVLKDEEICPFCHVGMLNKYKACGLCSTILGQGKPIKRAHNRLTEADLASLPDLDLKMDISVALEDLTELERRVILSISQGFDTLDGLANVFGMARVSLWRVYVRAKSKLQKSLLLYSV